MVILFGLKATVSRLMVFEKRARRSICGTKRDEVTEKWQKLHKDYLNNLYSSPTVIGAIKSAMRRVGSSERMGNTLKVYTVLVRKPETMM